MVIAGYQKKNAILTDQEKWTVAYHEIGHALVAAKQSHSAPVQKITIIPRTSGALGYTMQVEEGNHYLMTKEEIENKIATLTGGRAAEEVMFGTISTGASNDIEQATKLARAMITRYGMSKDFDMVALETVNNQYQMCIRDRYHIAHSISTRLLSVFAQKSLSLIHIWYFAGAQREN